MSKSGSVVELSSNLCGNSNSGAGAMVSAGSNSPVKADDVSNSGVNIDRDTVIGHTVIGFDGAITAARPDFEGDVSSVVSLGDGAPCGMHTLLGNSCDGASSGPDIPTDAFIG